MASVGKNASGIAQANGKTVGTSVTFASYSMLDTEVQPLKVIECKNC